MHFYVRLHTQVPWGIRRAKQPEASADTPLVYDITATGASFAAQFDQRVSVRVWLCVRHVYGVCVCVRACVCVCARACVCF